MALVGSELAPRGVGIETSAIRQSKGGFLVALFHEFAMLLTYSQLGPRTFAIRCNKEAVQQLFACWPDHYRKIYPRRRFMKPMYLRKVKAGPPVGIKSSEAFAPDVKSWFDQLELQYGKDYSFEWNLWNCNLKFRKSEMAMLFKLTWS